jgi:periplasmic divalent cation tolerance protein
MTQALLVWTNCPDEAIADRIALALVEQGLAACVNRYPPVQSSYRWHGNVERASEIPLLIKTTHERYPELERAIQHLHPYDLPEIIAVPITAGHAGYLRWITEQTTPPLAA